MTLKPEDRVATVLDGWRLEALLGRENADPGDRNAARGLAELK